MTVRNVLLAWCALACAGPALAVDFGVMESADPVRRGDFKFEAYPLAARKTSRQEENTGANVAIGYGFGEHWDAELQIATYDDIMFAGSDVEYSFFDTPRVELSLDGGAHYGNSDFGNQLGLDLTPLASYKPASLPGFKWNGAVDMAWDRVDVAHPRPGSQDHYFSAYLVPGAQYRVTKEVDLIGEVGIGLNANSNTYASAGLAFYFR